MGPNDSNDHQQGSHDESQQHGDRQDAGRTGEGAASALRHMISQGDRQWHQGGDADDAAGHKQ